MEMSKILRSECINQIQKVKKSPILIPLIVSNYRRIYDFLLNYFIIYSCRVNIVIIQLFIFIG